MSQRREVDRLLAQFGARISWKPQPHQPNCYQTKFEIDHAADELASHLAKCQTPFEIEAQQERFLYHPGLGIKRQQLDEAGEIVFRSGEIRNQLVASGGNMAEFERRLRVVEGQAWLDLLEPYRLGVLRYDAMPKAV
jgi:hypothetical protein